MRTLVQMAFALAILAPVAYSDHSAPAPQALFEHACGVLLGRVERGSGDFGECRIRVLHALKGEFPDGWINVTPNATHGCACDGKPPTLAIGEVWLLFLAARDDESRTGFVGHADNAWYRIAPADAKEEQLAPSFAAMVALAGGADPADQRDALLAARTPKTPEERYLDGFARWKGIVPMWHGIFQPFPTCGNAQDPPEVRVCILRSQEDFDAFVKSIPHPEIRPTDAQPPNDDPLLHNPAIDFVHTMFVFVTRRGTASAPPRVTSVLRYGDNFEVRYRLPSVDSSEVVAKRGARELGSYTAMLVSRAANVMLVLEK